MVRTRQCDFCGGDIEPGTGTMFVHVDGTTVHFCSAKCEKNADLGREARDQEWTAAGQATAGAEPADEPQPAEPTTSGSDGQPADADVEPVAGDADDRAVDSPDLAAAESEGTSEAADEDAEPINGDEQADRADVERPTPAADESGREEESGGEPAESSADEDESGEEPEADDAEEVASEAAEE